MVKKIIEGSFIILLVLFSFYYTDKVVDMVEETDPIMQEIVTMKSSVSEAAVDAVVEEDYLVPGYNGVEVNTKKSFDKMKQYGSYNESLLVFEEVEPSISMEDYYDKYISSGNGFTNRISLVFKFTGDTKVDEVNQILNDNDAYGTFFVDGVWLENNKDKVTMLASDFHQVELLSYNNQYDKLLFEASLDQLETITNQEGKYCYAEYDSKEVLELCSKEKMHTIIPTLLIKDNLYQQVKGNITNGSIISININKETLKELNVTLKYLKQRGYILDTLDHLLNEARDFDK